ncbi:MAG: helix-turn-helix domain-containing protein [Sulfuricaulis sp.]
MTRSTHHPHYQKFLDLLRSERIANGVTQVQLAEKISNRQVFVSKIETGERRLDVVELIEYVDAFDGDIVGFVTRLRNAIRRLPKTSDRKLAVRTSPRHSSTGRARKN